MLFHVAVTLRSLLYGVDVIPGWVTIQTMRLATAEDQTEAQTSNAVYGTFCLLQAIDLFRYRS